MNEAVQGGRAALVDASRLTIRKGSKSFAAAARLFDLETRENAYMLYAWCRHCDDRIDNQVMGFGIKPQAADTTRAVLAELRDRTQGAIDDQPSDDPVFEGLRYVLKRAKIPGRFALQLLDGFEMDADGAEYKTLADTLQYCYYVAGVVGVMMAHVMDARDDEALQRAADLGIAFQLTNIARDVREDAGVGRIYLPGEWLAEAGIGRGELLAAEHADALTRVVARLLDEADRYYASADEGLRALGFRSAWAVAAARDIYREIGEQVRAAGHEARSRRVVVARRRKLAGVAGGMLAAARATLVDRNSAPPPRDATLWRAPQLKEG